MQVEPAFSCLSATRTLRRVLVRRPRAEELTSWRELGWRAEPDAAEIAREHAELCELLAGAGAEVVVADEPVPGDADAIYAYDPVLIGPDGALLLRIGKRGREAEAEALAPALALGDRRALMLMRNIETRTRLEAAGVEVLTYEGRELSKGDGGPTCLTRPLLRG